MSTATTSLSHQSSKVTTVVVLVLGAQNDPAGNLSEMARQRVFAGLREYRRRPGAMLMVTSTHGHFNRASMPHAYYMAQLLLKEGVRSQDILPYVESVNTVEEAALSREILHGMALRLLCVVTSDFHIRRARLIFEHFYDPALLLFVGASNTICGEELARRQAHKEQQIMRVFQQGGVFFRGVLYRHKEPNAPSEDHGRTWDG